jgi:hypothetical protein
MNLGGMGQPVGTLPLSPPLSGSGRIVALEAEVSNLKAEQATLKAEVVLLKEELAKIPKLVLPKPRT